MPSCVTAGEGSPNYPYFKSVGLILCVSLALRAYFLFRTALVPGINGGYYLIQARSLIETGLLGLPDLPLTLVLQSILAKILAFMSGTDIDTCIVFAVKMIDACLAGQIAIPIYLLGCAWVTPRQKGDWVPFLAATVTALGAPTLSMVGDFQKNSLGPVWLSWLIYFLYDWMAKKTPRSGVAWIVFLGLAGLTHIGVSATSILLVALTLVIRLSLQEKIHWRGVLLFTAMSLVVSATVQTILIITEFSEC